MSAIQKFVRLPNNEVIIFSNKIEHVAFSKLNPVSAGFCVIDIDDKRVNCFGESHTLQLEADEYLDTDHATSQIFGSSSDEN
jgi:hypothetical protein